MRKIPTVAALLFLLLPAGAGEDWTAPPAALGEALDAMGISVSDLGYRPMGFWARYPTPKTTPYVLPFFADLWSHPLSTYEFTRTLGNAAEDLLTPAELTAPPEKGDAKETLFKLGVALGADPLLGAAIRGYSANLAPEADAHAPLFHALKTLLERAGEPLHAPSSFGGAYQEDAEHPAADLRKEIAAIPEPLRLPLARYVLNLVDARHFIDVGLRDVSQKMRDRLFAILPGFLDDMPDGKRYRPVVDDIARRVDRQSLAYGCLKALQATEDARRELTAVSAPQGGWAEFSFRLETPWGAVVFRNAKGALSEKDPFCVVSFSDASVSAPVGATGPHRPLSVALLLGAPAVVGDDAKRVDVQKAAGSAQVASGILGCGIVYSAGAHATSYGTGHYGLGFGFFGLGALVDEGGDDSYEMASGGMGAGVFGIGFLFDAAGSDRYTLREGDGEGFGGPSGVGVLADRSGDDLYYAEPSAAKAGRADYHSADAIAANNAQGVGVGRRGDGSDGHDWAGGLGALLDVAGNDRYVAGNFTQGLGYWFGTGLLWDGGGDDSYQSVYFTQGSGAHFAIGALVDEGGNDTHVLKANAGAAFGFGWDGVNAFLIDRGKGNDRYDAKCISFGCAEVRSNAFFIDEGGDDTYVFDAGQKGFGDVDHRKGYETPRRTTTYDFHAAQVAVFLDLGGKDTYLRRAKDGTTTPDPEAGDKKTWHLRKRDPKARYAPNVSIAQDK